MTRPTLDPVELRVLGALVEKSLATPDAYPLSLNALVNACNQKSSRDPVMSLDEREVSGALDRLRRRGLVGTASGAGHRAAKFRHLVDTALDLSRRELAVLAVLMLRGPQTPGEIRTRTARMAPLASTDDAEECLWMLSERDEPLAERLPRSPGQSADRYAHTLDGETVVATGAEPARQNLPSNVPPEASTALPDRVAVLERDVRRLQDALADITEQLRAMR